jgi:hypothetical protein
VLGQLAQQSMVPQNQSIFILYWLSSYGSRTVLGWSPQHPPPLLSYCVGTIGTKPLSPPYSAGGYSHPPLPWQGESTHSDDLVILVGLVAQHAVG